MRGSDFSLPRCSTLERTLLLLKSRPPQRSAAAGLRGRPERGFRKLNAATTIAAARRPLTPPGHRGKPLLLPPSRFWPLAGGPAPPPMPARAASPQPYPARPVRMIVPPGAGAPTDVFARLIAQKLSDSTGKQFYVEN